MTKKTTSDQQAELGLLSSADNVGPVECLGMTFESDDARRDHFLKLLKERLQDPELREAEGFPIADDEEILRLSDPPFYTACPNPFAADLVRHYGKPYRAETDDYSRGPFATDISHGKSDPIYTAHSYHTKVPHQAIMRFILHFTNPGDIVLDGFCGTGMTGVAAQMCGCPSPELKAELEKDLPNAEWGARFPVLLDLSPFATFIAHNYNAPINAGGFERELGHRIQRASRALEWAYDYSPGGSGDEPSSRQMDLTIWSDVFICANCGEDIIYWENGVARSRGEIEPMICPHCDSENPKARAAHRLATSYDPLLRCAVQQPLQVPVLVRSGRDERAATDRDREIAERCLTEAVKMSPPSTKMMYRDEPWGDVYRAGYHAGITHVHHFYNPRQLLALSTLWSEFRQSPYSRRLQLVLTSFASRNGFRGNRFVINKHNPNGRINGPLTNCLYFPSLLAEQNLVDLAVSKGKDITKAFRELERFPGKYCLSTESATGASNIPDNSVDYIFIDPPFGANIMYSEMNFLVESWLGCRTGNTHEAIVNASQGKNEQAYRLLMTRCLRQFYRVLKPGRWLTMEFHNSQNAIWNAIQTALGDAGFVVADVRTLDKKKGTVYQEYYTSGATKHDLVISAYKPNSALEQRFTLGAGSEEGAWAFVRAHLQQLPVLVREGNKAEVVKERQSFLLFDRMVAFHVQRGATVPMSAAQFYEGLSQRFSERDGMFFLSEQVAEYDRQRSAFQEVLQLPLFVKDEQSAILWLRQWLTKRPQTFQELHAQFTRQLQAWAKHEEPVELRDLLAQNFLHFDGRGPVPSQIHRYLSTNYKDFRNLEKEDPRLLEKARDRWYVPDPSKQAEREAIREKSLLREFDEYKTSTQRKLKVFRTEAVRVGFKACWQERDYGTIVKVAEKLPDAVLQEDEKLLMYYDNALTRLGDE